MSDEKIKIAIPKGRLLDGVMPILVEAGLQLDKDQVCSRTLIHDCEFSDVSICLVRSRDVPLLLLRGAVDIGVVGSDTLLDMGSLHWNDALDLETCKCRMSVIGREGTDVFGQSHLTVATKYPLVATNYFSKHGTNVSVTKMHGSVEMAPMLGIADVAVDIVDTGATLMSNGLVEIHNICSVSAHVVTSAHAFGARRKKLKGLIDRIMIAKEFVQQELLHLPAMSYADQSAVM